MINSTVLVQTSRVDAGATCKILRGPQQITFYALTGSRDEAVTDNRLHSNECVHVLQDKWCLKSHPSIKVSFPWNHLLLLMVLDVILFSHLSSRLARWSSVNVITSPMKVIKLLKYVAGNGNKTPTTEHDNTNLPTTKTSARQPLWSPCYQIKVSRAARGSAHEAK